MKVRLAANIQPDSIVDGEGIRTVIWFQGCLHHCTGCHNPETWNLNGGIELDLDTLKNELSQLKYQNGITLSGGDPFYQSLAALEIAKYAHSLGLNVWCYTGYTFEEILNEDENKLELLKNIDVLIDGRFEIEKKSLACKFRGSTNQRIIDVTKSLTNNEVILYYGD